MFLGVFGAERQFPELLVFLVTNTVFDAVGLDGAVYLADGASELLALPP